MILMQRLGVWGVATVNGQQRAGGIGNKLEISAIKAAAFCDYGIADMEVGTTISFSFSFMPHTYISHLHSSSERGVTLGKWFLWWDLQYPSQKRLD